MYNKFLTKNMVVVSNDPCVKERAELFQDISEDYRKFVDTANFCEDNRSSAPLLNLPLQSVNVVLEELAKGIKQQNVIAVKQCICNLDQRLDQTNALNIFTSLSNYIPFTNNNYEPSAPPLDVDVSWLQDLVQNLRNSCLLEIDKHADFVLKQPEILKLNYNDLLSIVERNTLQVSNESVIYVTIYKWAIEECHRRRLETNDLNNLKIVLGRLHYSPRYGLMSKYKFTSKIMEGIPGPMRSGILDEKDWRLIKFYLEDKAKNRPVKDLPHKWSVPRNFCLNTHKKISSACSSPTALGRDRTGCERCIINFLSCWTAIFD